MNRPWRCSRPRVPNWRSWTRWRPPTLRRSCSPSSAATWTNTSPACRRTPHGIPGGDHRLQPGEPGDRLKFGQDLLEEAAEIDLEDPDQLAAYEADREQGLEESRAAIDETLEQEDLDAIVSDGATIAVGARAAYPSVSVPSGYHEPGAQPASLIFMGTAFSDAELLSYAHAYEQAAQVWQPPARGEPQPVPLHPGRRRRFAEDCG